MLDLLRKIGLKLQGGVVTLRPKGNPRGRVLFSYTTLPFISLQSVNGHSNRWESRRMAEIWRDRGFVVDVVDFNNENFTPKKPYDYCVDISHHLERLSPLLGPSCVKVFHIPAAHWKFQNDAELARIADIERRRGVKLSPRRIVPPSKNIELCDVATILGNDFTVGTYSFAGKKIVRIPISTTHIFPSPEAKDFSIARNGYVWLGGAGMAHKGLNLVLEAFAAMPEYRLTVFGKKDADFAEAYHKELFETPNIHYKGMVDLDSPQFSRAITESVGMIFPSCSEGSSGGVVSCMHAGLIPITSYETGVDIAGFGTVLKRNSVEEIKKEVRELSSRPADELRRRAVAAWKFANERHTRDSFSKTYENFVDDLIQGKIAQ